MTSNSHVLYIPARETTTGKTTSSDVQVRRWVGVVPVMFKPRQRKILAETGDALSSVGDSSAIFQIQLPMFPSLRKNFLRKKCHGA